MRQGKTFDEFMAGRPRREKEPAGPSPYGVPGVYEDDARFILAAMGRGRWPTPSNETTTPAPEVEPKPEIPAPAPVITAEPKRRRLSKAERLERKAAKLRAEIERLKK